MISVLILSSVEKEREEIVEYYKNIAAGYSDDDWQFHIFDSSCSLDDIFRHILYVDIACVDMTLDIGIKAAEIIRKQSGLSSIVAIADNDTSPARYVKVSVGVNALLVRPMEVAVMHRILGEVFEYYKAHDHASLEKEFFVIENKEGKQIIPYRCIFYFESRRKKIVAVTEKKELTFYGTLDSLAGRLPHDFVRCHRSFIISCCKISCIRPSDHMIRLVNGASVPFSRKYQNMVREIILR